MNDTKERILFIALKFFLVKPYTEVTMREILDASGLSKGGFYHHFESKEQLYKEVVDKYLMVSLIEEINIYHKNHTSLSFKEFGPAYLGNMLTIAYSSLKKVGLKVDEVNFYLIMFDMMKYYDGFIDIMNEMHDKEVHMLTSIIENAKTCGEIKKELDSLSLANHFHALMHGISVLTILDVNMENAFDRINDLFNEFYKMIRT
ncbi:MAG: hypothetical protein CVU05_07415 [Bacteroidetes bacterium HGW-Bacteroidetes-21]|nr:MAG: hypothetical protein CVU05_07415 [Bacteroidetes bacterium HGW-Bacteroidetes-21]